MIHFPNAEGKPKCGTRGWGFYRSFNISVSNDRSQVDCKKCLGTGRKPQKCADVSESLVGKIIHYSWGYDMTINEFFEITKQTKHTVMAEKIGTNGYNGFTGSETPDVNKRSGEMVRFLVKPNYSGTGYYFIGNGGRCASVHDGRPTYFNRMD